jgi:hypothetical protein
MITPWGPKKLRALSRRPPYLWHKTALTCNIHFGYANLGLYVTSKMHIVQNSEYLELRNLKLTSTSHAIFF